MQGAKLMNRRIEFADFILIAVLFAGRYQDFLSICYKNAHCTVLVSFILRWHISKKSVLLQNKTHFKEFHHYE